MATKGNIMATTTLVRKNIESLSSSDWTRFLAALQACKSSGFYDRLTEHHWHAAFTPTAWIGDSVTINPDGSTSTNSWRNSAHNGPAFLPWHRWALKILEDNLVNYQKTKYPKYKPVAIPYWPSNRYTGRTIVNGANVPNWTTAGVWTKVGGNGDPNNINPGVVVNGPFTNWRARVFNFGTGQWEGRQFLGIIRQFSDWNMLSVDLSSKNTYDESPYDQGSGGSVIRAHVEGFHNLTHVNIGGDMTQMSSPNDPIFWFHHCNVDRIWAIWQQSINPNSGINNVNNYNPKGSGDGSPDGPDGNKDADQLKTDPYYGASGAPSTTVINTTFNWSQMGYQYDNMVP